MVIELREFNDKKKKKKNKNNMDKINFVIIRPKTGNLMSTQHRENMALARCLTVDRSCSHRGHFRVRARTRGRADDDVVRFYHEDGTYRVCIRSRHERGVVR